MSSYMRSKLYPESQGARESCPLGKKPRSLLFLSALFLFAGYAARQAPAISQQAVSEKPELILQTGHSQKAEGIAFSPDGRYVATGSVDHTIKIWEAATGRELRTLAGHTGAVKAVAFSPDARLLASGGNDGRIKFWELASGRESASLAGHMQSVTAQSVTALAFSPDGRSLASAGADFSVKLWDVASQREARTYTGHFGLVTALAFSPDGNWLASGARDKTVRLWSLLNASSTRQPLEHTGEVKSLKFSPDGKTLAVAGHDAKVQLWTWPKMQRVKKPLVHLSGVLAVGFSRDGAKLLTCAEDRSIRIFNAATLLELSTLPDNSSEIEKYEIAVFSPNGDSLAAGIGLPTINLRRTDGGGRRLLENHNNPIYSLTLSLDGRWLATGNQDMTVTLWDLASGRVVANLPGNTGSITTVAFSPDSLQLAAGSKGGMILLWDIAAVREQRRWTAHPEGVNSLLFSSSGKQLISSGVDSVVRVWEVETGKEALAMAGHTKEVRALSAGADGKQFASAGADQTVRLWAAGSSQPAQTLTGHTGNVFAVAMSADGRTVVSGGADRLVKVWDAATGRELQSLAGMRGRIDSLAISPDGQRLAAGDATGEIKLWEKSRAEFTPAGALSGHAGDVSALCFAGEGKWLISGSEDGSVRFWEVATGEPAATLVSLSNNSDWLVVAPDGLFDGSPAAFNQILWRFGHNTFSTAPVEIFFNEFFHPNLLAEVMTPSRPRAVENIALRDRRQPAVKLAVQEAANRLAKINLEIAEASADGDYAMGSGVYDVRLFRNGSLVKVWRGDLLQGRAGAVKLQHTVSLVAGENRLTAYAFNRDNVKSADETLILTGSEQLARPGTLYILSVGVNQYANPEFNLKFAVADAIVFSEELQQQQSRLKRFAKIEVVNLLDKQATKANLLGALKRLARNEASKEPALVEMERLQPAQPEDAVLVYFSGHGLAEAPRFYLVPHDLGYQGRRDELDQTGWRQMLANSISDLDLEQHFEKVDAGQLVFVIDACYSGQVLEAEEKRRGPMNSKGLAQLAYEKGMNILTASQSYQVAWENSRLGHGYLTQALIVDGIKALGADHKPHDGQVLLREWLDYATEQAPRLQNMQENKNTQNRGIKLATGVKLTREIQRPRVFYRREAESRQLVIAVR